MISYIKKFVWKAEGMEFTDTPSNSNGVFSLKFTNKNIGTLKYNDSKWVFFYSEEFKKNPTISPITDFPDIDKVYESSELWPFFASRIPALNQPYQFKKIASAKADTNDAVALLKIFGSNTITNPYELIAI